MKTTRLCILLSMVLALPFERAAAEHPWVQVQSPHFTIICNGSEKDGREAAVDLERMRTVLMKALPSIRQDPNVPVIVFVTADESTFATLVPSYQERAQGSKPQSIFQRGRDRNYIVMRMVFRSPAEYQLKYDYAGLMASANFRRAPLWLVSGFASFFATSEITEGQAKVGMPSPAFTHRLEHSSLMNLSKLFTIRTSSDEYKDPEKRWVFDAQSWGLIHYLMLGDRGAHRAQLENYLQLLARGKKQSDVAQEAFGDLQKLQDKLVPYYAQKGFLFSRMDLPRESYAEGLTVHGLSTSTSDSWLAEYYLRFKKQAEAKSLIEAALAANPGEPRAHEAQGIYYLQQADYENALKEFSAAGSEDSSLYLTYYYRGILSSFRNSSADVPKSSEQDLRRSVEIAPKYAPAELALARLIAKTGGNLTEAAAFARGAYESEWGIPLYALAYANILLLEGESVQAEAQARQVLESELSPLEKESATGLLKLANECKPGGPCKALDHLEFGSPGESPVTLNAETIASGSAAVDPAIPLHQLRGVIRTINCTADGRVATLASGEKDLAYTMIKSTRVSWPETFWLDGAYLDICKHFAGQPASVVYRLAQTEGTLPEARAVEIQDRY